MKKTVLAMIMVAAAACTQQPTIQTGPDAEISFDGLVRVDHSRLANAWIDPDIDLADYSKIILGPAEFEFRTVPKSSRTMRHSNNTEFWISPEDRERLVEEVGEAFREELAKLESWELVEADQRGPETLIAVGALHDIVSNVPPDMIGRGEIFLSSVGEATLIIELRDSLSGKTVFRAVDRRSAETSVGGVRSNPATTWLEVRRLARDWGTRMREGLDSVRER
jgi:hypothetical protein